MTIMPSTAGASGLTSAKVDFAASGDNVLVAAVANKVVKLYKILIVLEDAADVIFYDGAAGTALTGAMSISAGGSIVLDFDGEPWFQTSAGNALVVNLSGASQCSGRAYYRQE